MVWSANFNAMWEAAAKTSTYRNGYHRTNRAADNFTAPHTPASSPSASTETRSGFNLQGFQELSHIKRLWQGKFPFRAILPPIFHPEIKWHSTNKSWKLVCLRPIIMVNQRTTNKIYKIPWTICNFLLKQIFSNLHGVINTILIQTYTVLLYGCHTFMVKYIMAADHWNISVLC